MSFFNVSLEQNHLSKVELLGHNAIAHRASGIKDFKEFLDSLKAGNEVEEVDHQANIRRLHG